MRYCLIPALAFLAASAGGCNLLAWPLYVVAQRPTKTVQPEFDDLGNQVPVHFGHLFDEFGPQGSVLVGFGLVYDGHIPVFLKLLQVNPNQTSQFFFRGCRLADGLPETLEDLTGFVFVELNKDVVLVFEIKVDGAIGYARLFGNLGNRRLKKPLLGKYHYGGIENALIFGHIFLFRDDGKPPGNSCL